MSENQNNHSFQDKTRNNYFTIIPNLIFELGLNSNEIAFYCFCKKVAGENGACFYGTRAICEILQITDKTLKKCKETLVKKRLISLEVKSKKDGGNHIISIIDIMKENVSFFFNKYKNNVSENDGTLSENDGTLSENDGRGCRKMTAKEEPIKEEPINKKENKEKKTVASAPLASKEAHVLSRCLFNKIKEKDVKAKEPKYATWDKDFDKLLKNRTYDEILEMIENVHKDTFWASNILCPKKLSTQFTKLILHFQNKNKQQLINFNRMLSYDLKKGLIKNKRKEEGMFEIQPDSIYNRETKEYYKFTLPASQFVNKINNAFRVKFSLTSEEIQKYG